MSSEKLYFSFWFPLEPKHNETSHFYSAALYGCYFYRSDTKENAKKERAMEDYIYF